ncbi:SGNH/GDSL hydrolase N-terminal domain-containing protein [Bacteroides helcogenes]|uniref:SGNH/GDSL hydrolase N-terminal domain-containing protein n=1 Tax=Bacteroides helcogenes TaxID=290053 RepID=UPI002A90F21D|nr:SGNH/GDSL hydrolase N-terminal domain-containing protein [Bacteroides helcogenes]MDY5238815.1 SGNH/GDSL hydrolase N-terminal domain-containing protein [Bacteroides helcogenes]
MLNGYGTIRWQKAIRCNAKEINVRYTVAGSLAMPHMPSTGVSGVDLYATLIGDYPTLSRLRWVMNMSYIYHSII